MRVVEERIRLAALADAPALGHIAATSWRATYPGLVPEELIARLDEKSRTDRFTQILSQPQPERRLWVVEDAGAVLGYAHAGPTRDDGEHDGVGELYAIYFLPEAWGRGLGRALQEHALADLRARGFREATVWVLTTNDRARRFYEATGFHLDVEGVVKECFEFELPHTRYRRTL